MIPIVGDTHSHTIACGHALGTITENAAYAKRKGLRFLAITEHCGKVPVAPHEWFFNNIMWMPPVVDDILLIRGVESNIINHKGDIDIAERFQRELEWVIASAHKEVFEDTMGDGVDFTEMYLGVAKNPYVDVIGHCGDPRFPHDMEQTIIAYRDNGKIVEINSNTPRSRKGSHDNCVKIAQLCKKHGVSVVMSSDAHCPQDIGNVAASQQLLAEVDFPEELVLNADYERFCSYVEKKRNIVLPR